MSVLLPTTTVHVLSPERTLDGHGAEVTHGWTQRGPFEAHVTAGAVAESRVGRTEVSTSLVVVAASEAWPIRGADRLLNDGTGEVYEVVGAVQVPDVQGVPLGHVRITATVLAEATA